MKKSILPLSLFLFWFISSAIARPIPQYDLLAPETVSPQLKMVIETGLPDWWQTHPTSSEDWKAFQKNRDETARKNIPSLQQSLNVHCVKGEMAGVPVFILEPEKLPAQNSDRILLHIHGGGYVLGAGESGLGEAIFVAGLGKFKVVSVDYRMPPQHPYPAALNDSLKVYEALLKTYFASHIGIFGTSTGGGLTAALVLRAKKDGLPLPGAIALGTPWTDLTLTGDSYRTNENVDNVLVSYNGWLKAAAQAYANGHDLKDPFISPIYGDVTNFPPTLLATGTRDLFLSNTVRMHTKLLKAKIPAKLLVFEGLSHAQYLHLGPDADETILYYEQLKEFFDQYLK